MPGLNLLSLLGQVAGGVAGMHGANDVATDEETERLSRDGITVSGGNAAADPAAPPKANPLNARRVEPYSPFSDRSSVVAPTEAQMKEKIPRHGMFGVKGTLRDVLGVLGDTMLMASGGKPVYRGIRQGERAGDARLGMTGGPAARREAIERTAQIDPDAADKMMSAYDTDQYRQDNLDSQNTARKSMADDRKFTNVAQARTSLQRIVGSGKTPEQRAALARHYAPLLAKQADAEAEDLGVDEGMTDEDLQAFANGDITRYQQEQLPMRAATVAQGQQRINETHRVNKRREDGGMMDRPKPAGRAPQQQNEVSYLKELIAKGGKRTPEENDYVKTKTQGARGRGSSGRRSVSPDGSSGSGVSRVINGRTFTLHP